MYSEKTPDDGQRNCPKHVEFYSKNKFEKLVHLVGFIIRIYHDARSLERKICVWIICDFIQIVHIMCAFTVTVNETNNIKFIKSRIFVAACVCATN